MQIQVRCGSCRNTISLDEAFAGGMCRCPHCKSIVEVPAEARSQRPVPGRPSEPAARPTVPTARPAPEARADSLATPGGSPREEEGDRRSPAAPVPVPGHTRKHRHDLDVRRKQGILTLVLLVGVVVLLAVAGWLLVEQFKAPEVTEDKRIPAASLEEQSTPFAPVGRGSAGAGPTVAGVLPVSPPVTYVVDAGASMLGKLGFALRMAGASVRSMQGGRFSLLAVTEGEVRSLSAGLIDGGAGGAERIAALEDELYARGATSEKLAEAVKQAVSGGASTVVVFAAKSLPAGQVDALAAQADVAGVTVHTVAITEYPGEAADLSALAEATGGKGLRYNPEQLARLLRDSEKVGN
jgi:hypothetical protein